MARRPAQEPLSSRDEPTAEDSRRRGRALARFLSCGSASMLLRELRAGRRLEVRARSAAAAVGSEAAAGPRAGSRLGAGSRGADRPGAFAPRGVACAVRRAPARPCESPARARRAVPARPWRGPVPLALGRGDGAASSCELSGGAAGAAERRRPCRPATSSRSCSSSLARRRAARARAASASSPRPRRAPARSGPACPALRSRLKCRFHSGWWQPPTVGLLALDGRIHLDLAEPNPCDCLLNYQIVVSLS